MTALILRFLWRPVALLLAVLAVWWRGRAAAMQKAAAKDAAANIATRERMDDAPHFDGNGPDAAHRWLRERHPDQR